MTKDTRFCEDCRFCITFVLDRSLSKCGHPEARSAEHRVARGAGPFCSTVRSRGSCGPDGNLWEPQEETTGDWKRARVIWIVLAGVAVLIAVLTWAEEVM